MGEIRKRLAVFGVAFVTAFLLLAVSGFLDPIGGPLDFLGWMLGGLIGHPRILLMILIFIGGALVADRIIG